MQRIADWTTSLYVQLKTLREDEKGQALVEYALILALVSVVAIVTLTAIGTNVDTIFGKIRDDL
jgi:pilus assembly protein Flp/PilA